MFLVLSKNSGFFEHQEMKSSSRTAGGDTEKRAPGGGSKYYRFWKHRGECEIPAPEPVREDAEQRSGGSQGGHSTEREL